MNETTIIDRIKSHSDIGLALGVIAILVMLILPMPAIMLDMALAVSITFSVLILMTALFIHTPLEFSSFPTILLIATMMRLALNIASTRLILSHGHEGTSAAGHVIEAFGNLYRSGLKIPAALPSSLPCSLLVALSEFPNRIGIRFISPALAGAIRSSFSHNHLNRETFG